MAITVSAASKAIIQSTIPAVAKAGDSLTKAFYKRMFDNHPSLLNTFNLSHQAKGDQPKALFNSIVFAAKSALTDGEASIPSDVVACIAHKHCALNITPDQYEIVGSNLLATIEAELGVGKEVLDAWGELYGQVAGALIATEKALYEASQETGGWAGTKPFKIVSRRHVSEDVAEITLKPSGDLKIPMFTPGQYITVWPTAEQLAGANAQPRQYSLISEPGADHFTLSIKYVEGGVVSPWIHSVGVGAEVAVSAPFGPLHIPTNAKKYVFVSSGAGISGNLGVMRNLVWAAKDTPVHWVYGAKDGSHHPFRPSLVGLGKDCPWFHRHVFYEEPQADDVEGLHYHHKGSVDLNAIADKVGDLKDAHVVLTGFGPGLAANKAAAVKLGADPASIHVELFSSGLNRPE